MSVKEQLLASWQNLPDDVTWAEAIQRMQIAAALASADAEIDAGKFVTQEQAEAHIDACLRKSSGRSKA